MIHRRVQFSTLLFLLICVAACATQKAKPVIEYIDRTIVAQPPAYLQPMCAKSTPASVALATCGTAVDAWLADSTALDDCAARSGALWVWLLGAAREPSPAPPQP